MQRKTFYPETGKRTFPALINWTGHDLNECLFYSYRDTVYDRSTYPADLHYHEYYELVIFLEGNVRYICESSVYVPQYGDVILVPPGQLHMSVLQGNRTRYRRHVFYLTQDAFDGARCGALSELLKKFTKVRFLCVPEREAFGEMIGLLERLSGILGGEVESMERALGFGYTVQLFYLLNRCAAPTEERKQQLPEPIRHIKEYVDSHITEFSTVNEVAEALFYSREYISRAFKRYFHTTVSDYIRKRRIAMARELIAAGVPLIEVCYRIGFGNMSTFIRSFHAVAGMCPSEYREMVRSKQ